MSAGVLAWRRAGPAGSQPVRKPRCRRKGRTQYCWMVCRRAGVAVLRCGTPGAHTSFVLHQLHGCLTTRARRTVNVGVSGLVVAQHLYRGAIALQIPSPYQILIRVETGKKRKRVKLRKNARRALINPIVH